jgi:hypothetical protein
MAETEDSSVLSAEAIFLILLVLFTAGVLYYLYDSSNSAYVWEDFYAKQTATFLNSAKVGEEVTFDIQPAVKIAKRNGLDITNPENLIRIDSQTNRVCVKLSKGTGNCYPYFNDVAVRSTKTILDSEGLSLSFIVDSKTGSTNE